MLRGKIAFERRGKYFKRTDIHPFNRLRDPPNPLPSKEKTSRIRHGLKIKTVVRARFCARPRGNGSRNLSRVDD